MSKSSPEFMEINTSKKAFQTLSQKVDQAILTLVNQQTRFSLVASLFCATILLIGLHGATHNTTLYSWYGFVIGVILARAFLVMIFLRQKSPVRNLGIWRNLFTIGAALGGLSWGLAGSMLFLHYNSNQQMLIVLIIAGITAGAVPALAGIIRAGVAFLLCALIPLIVNLLLMKSDINLLFDLTLLAYMVYLISLVYRTNSILVHTIALQFENSALLSNLYKAKDQLEVTNSKLEQAATHDPLTNVANRNLFTANFQIAIDRAREQNNILALLFIDLDNFKEVNDSFGHYVGDQLLLGIINRLEVLCKNNDNISRLGGDEFTVVLENVKTSADVAKMCHMICQAIAQPLKIDDREIKVSASVGISLYPTDGEEPEMLLQTADKAMYFAKQKGGNNFLFSGEVFIN